MKELLLPMLLLAICACSPAKVFEGEVNPLRLKAALPINSSEAVEPSGLTHYQGDLYTISDDHDDTIFRIVIGPEEATMEPVIRFDIAVPEGVDKIDFEGITHDENGNFYLVSERAFQVLKVSRDGEAAWVTPSLKSEGEAAGLFQVENANLEGIAHAGGGRFVLCAEREPRGLMQVALGSPAQVTRVIVNDSTSFAYQEGRPPDYTGLHFEADALYVLERGAHIVCQIEITADGVIERRAWSYEDIERDDAYAYKDKKYGRAEGLAMDDDNIYVILDNGGDSRRADKKDKRPQLLILERPRH